MKTNKTKLLIATSLIVFAILFALSFTWLSNYSSKIILSGPFKISIPNLSKSAQKHLIIQGYSPYNKLQILQATNGHNWECTLHCSFKSLSIYSLDSSLEINSIILTSGEKQMEINGSHLVTANKPLLLAPYLKGFNAKSDVLISILYFKEFQYLMLACAFLLLLLAFTILWFNKNIAPAKNKLSQFGFLFFSLFYYVFYFCSGVFKTDSGLFLIFLLIIPVLIFAHFSSHFSYFKEKPYLKIKSYWKVILPGFSISGFIAHFIFYLITGSAIITAGLFMYFSLFFTIFMLFVFLSRFSQTIKQKIKDIQLTLIVITICLCLIESIFIIKNYSRDMGHLIQYASPFQSNEKSRFHVWSNNHDLKANEFSYPRTINSEGLSDTEHPISKDSNEYRILGLGDSFTEGHGADSDSTWMKFLERSLHKYPLKKQTTFINAGISGSDPFFEFILLKEKLLKYKPDIVLLAINFTDITDVAARGGMQRFQPDGTIRFNKAPYWEPVYAMSYISRLFFAAMGYNVNLLNSAQCMDAETKITEIISNFDSLCSNNNCKLVLIFHPNKSEISRQKMQMDGIFQSIKAKGHPETLNLLDYFTKIEKIDASNASSYYWVEDMHNNAKGYAAFARGVEWKLKQMGIIDSLIYK